MEFAFEARLTVAWKEKTSDIFKRNDTIIS